MRRRQLEARLARELSSGSGLSMQNYDELSALTGAGDQRWRAKDLATHLLWSPSRLSHHVDRMQ
jgi:DNA-binding MarR family transcriptional regulator